MGKNCILYLFYSLILVSLPVRAQVEFVENRGQWPVPHALRARLQAGDFWLDARSATFVFSDFGKDKDKHGHPHASARPARVHEYRMVFENADPNCRVSGTAPRGRYHNYYLGSDPTKWKAGVPLYAEARQEGIYPGIDLRWSESAGRLKYEFQVQAGADPSRIRIAYQGASRLELRQGKLRIVTSLGTVEEQAPVCWQIRQGRKVPVTGRFRLLGKDRVGFDFPSGTDPRYPLVIDPVLVFSSFSGSQSDNWGFTATPGENGSAYSGGIVLGALFPVSPGAWDESFNGTNGNGSTFDMGILKFNSNGSSLLFATYLGGAGPDAPVSLVVDPQNNLLVLGASGSSDYPTSQTAYDNSFNGGTNATPFGFSLTTVRYPTGSDLVVSKLSPNGSQLLGSTFLGGSQNDGLLTISNGGGSPLAKNYGDPFRGEIAVDSLGRVYVASHTLSADFPTVQPLQAQKQARSDAVCARLDPGLTSLEFSTFLGGNGDDAAFSLQLGPGGTVFLSGGTASANFPVTPGTLQPVFRGGVDGFLCRFRPDAGLPSFRSTLIGTPAYDQSFFVQRDKQGNLYLFGQTEGAYPVTANVYANPGSSQFIHCISPNLDSTRFSTVFGNGNPVTNLAPTAFLVDDCGRIYCAGWGGSTNNTPGFTNGQTNGLPTTPGAFSTTTDGSDFYVLVLERNAQALSFATFFGSNSTSDHVDGGTSRFDKKGVVYQAVCAGCGGNSSFPTTPGVVSTLNRSTNCNNALFKYDFSLLKARFTPNVVQGCAPLAVRFQSQSVFATGFVWDFQDGTTVQTNLDTLTHVFDTAGTFTVKLLARNPEACPNVDSVTRTIVVERAPYFTGDSLAFCSDASSVTLGPLPVGSSLSYSWAPPDFLSTTTAQQVQVQNPDRSQTYTATVRTPLGCEKKAVFKVSDGRLRAKAKVDTLQGCIPLTLSFSASGYQMDSLRWFFGDGDSSGVLSASSVQSHTFSQSGEFRVVLQAKNDTTCQKTVSDTLVIRAFSLPGFGDTLLRYCTDEPYTLRPAVNRGQTFRWIPGQGLNDSTVGNPLMQNPVARVFRLEIADSNRCRASAQVFLRDGRLKAGLELNPAGRCTPVNLPVLNTSLNAQKSRYLWGNDSLDVVGSPGASLPIPRAGLYRIRLKVFSDTACLTTSEVEKTLAFGGIDTLPEVVVNFCPGDSAFVTAQSGSGYTYTWPSNARPLFNGFQARVWTFDSLTFPLAMADSFLCPGTQQIRLIPRKPKAEFGDSSLFEICLDRLNYRLTARTQPGLQYAWRFPGGEEKSGSQVTHQFPQRGTYPVRLIASQQGCPDTLIQNVVVNDPPLNLKADFSFRTVFSGCGELPSLEIENRSANADKFIWYWQGQSAQTAVPDIPVRGPAEFTLRLLAFQGLCSQDVEKRVVIREVSAPNLLTRDGNGQNDRLDLGDIPSGTRLEIRDRWGKSIFQTDSYQNDWTPPSGFGTGFYEFRLPNGQSCQSWVQVVER